MTSSKLSALAVFFIACIFVSSCKKDKVSPSPEPKIEVGSTGTISFVYRGKNVTYTIVRAKDGNLWTQQDMGAPKVASAMRDTLGYGDFFQWGRWDDGHQVRIPAATTISGSSIENNPNGVKGQNPAPFVAGWWNTGNQNDLWTAVSSLQSSSTNGCDPCKAIGEGWRLPTDEEWSNVVDIEAIKNSETAFNSNLRIPTSGWRNTVNPSVISAVGDDSWYWTSTAAGSSGKGVWILPGAVRKSYTDSRSWGTSIRCIMIAD